MNQCNENMPYIFISYSHLDSDLVLPIVNRLRAEGYNLWYDIGIEAGSEWDENVATHIENCSYFIVFVSEHYIGSKNCRDEINYSRDLDKEMFLIYLEDVELPGGMAMRLNRIQAVFWNRYMPEHTEAAYQKIFTAVGIEKTKVFKPDTDTEFREQSVSILHSQGMNYANKNEEVKEKDKSSFIKIALIICVMLIVILLVVVIVLGMSLAKNRNDTGGNTDSGIELYADVDCDHPLYDYYERAKYGDVEAMIYLGDAYCYGNNGVDIDYAESLYWIETAADTGDVTAMYHAACYYYNGNAVSADGYQKCLEWCDRILEIEPDNTDVMYMMGNCYYWGMYGVDEDPELAFAWWYEGASRGHLDCIYNISWCYEKGYGVQPNYDKAMEWNQVLIDAGYEF